MIKGIWWHIVVLLLAESLWIASSLNDKHRQKRQTRNTIYLQRLRDARYLPPIPIHLPQYYKEQSEHITRSPSKKEAVPWIPIDGTAKDVPRKNIYVPPLHPQPIIVTRKPLKTTFDVPLTKSIQVSHSKPNIQTVGYIRKFRVKVPEIVTTKNPPQKMIGNLAESTVQSLLNFTPIDDRWLPKAITTPSPNHNSDIPNHNFKKKLSSSVDTHRNYTGVRYGQAIPLTKSFLENQAQQGNLKNRTNFVMKFTPEDIKTSSEYTPENSDTSFFLDSSEGKPLVGNQDNHRTPIGKHTDSTKIPSYLWDEGNLPYQGHKTPTKKQHIFNNGPHSGDSSDTYSDWKTIYDSFQDAENIRTEFPKKGVTQSQNQGTFVNDPYNAEIFNSAFRNNKRGPNQNTRIFIKQKTKNPEAKPVQTIVPGVSYDDRSINLESLKSYDTESDQKIKSNLPYQGHATVLKNTSDSQYSSENNINYPYKTQQVLHSSGKTVVSPNTREVIEIGSGSKNNFDNQYKSSLLNSSTANNVKSIFLNSQDSIPSKFPLNDGNYNSMSNVYKNNNTLAKEKITVAEIPVVVGNQYNKTKSPNVHAILVFKNTEKPNDPKKRENIHIYQNTPELQSFLPMSNQNFNILHKNQNIRLVSSDEKSKILLTDESPNLKEIELKNPPEHLEFEDEDFLKPIVPIHFHKNTDSNKIINPFKYSARDRSGEANKPISIQSKTTEKALFKTSTEVPSSKIEYENNPKLENHKIEKETLDNVYFQPVFPEVSLNNHQPPPTQKFQNYNSDQSSQQVSDISKVDTSRTRPISSVSEKEISTYYDQSREKSKINKDIIVTKNINYSPKDTKRNYVQGLSNDISRTITPPPVITIKYNPEESGIVNTRDSTNQTDNYVIQLKPALVPNDSSNRPRKPNITLSSGMLAGILIAALIFLAFLTGSMVYAFHQWKFGRKKKRPKKKTSHSPRFPPEYLDENFAGNTYIHNNIFLPTPQNLDDRNSIDPDASSTTGEEVPPQESTSTSARVRRHPGVYREATTEE